jgi:hypothetical protein
MDSVASGTVVFVLVTGSAGETVAALGTFCLVSGVTERVATAVDC